MIRDRHALAAVTHDRFARSSLDAVAVRLDDPGACTGGWAGVMSPYTSMPRCRPHKVMEIASESNRALRGIFS